MAILKEWYRGNVNDFHHYNVKMADGTVKSKERRTLNMPKKICEDLSKLEWSEKVEIKLDGEKNTKKLINVLTNKQNDLFINIPIFLEKLHALGTMVTVEYKKNDKTIIDYIDGDVVLSYKYTNSYIYGIVTVSRTIEIIDENNKKYYTLLTYHEFEDNLYIKMHELYLSKNENTLGKEISFSEKYPNVLESEIIETEYPRFQVWRLPIANNFDTDSPMGLSVLANQIDKFKSIDIKYDSFNHEFESGKRRIIISASALKGKVVGLDQEGNPITVCYFDNNDDTYVALNAQDDKEPVRSIDFNLRTQEHIDAINTELNYLSAGVGLGNGFYKFDATGLKTATEVISENSDTYRTMIHNQAIIYNCLYDLIAAVCELENIKFKEITINLDDSIVEDTDKIKQQALTEYNAGLISKAEYFRRTQKLEDESAVEFVTKMNQEIQDETISDGSEFDIDE